MRFSFLLFIIVTTRVEGFVPGRYPLSPLVRRQLLGTTSYLDTLERPPSSLEKKDEEAASVPVSIVPLEESGLSPISLDATDFEDEDGEDDESLLMSSLSSLDMFEDVDSHDFDTRDETPEINPEPTQYLNGEPVQTEEIVPLSDLLVEPTIKEETDEESSVRSPLPRSAVRKRIPFWSHHTDWFADTVIDAFSLFPSFDSSPMDEEQDPTDLFVRMGAHLIQFTMDATKATTFTMLALLEVVSDEEVRHFSDGMVTSASAAARSMSEATSSKSQTTITATQEQRQKHALESAGVAVDHAMATTHAAAQCLLSSPYSGNALYSGAHAATGFLSACACAAALATNAIRKTWQNVERSLEQQQAKRRVEQENEQKIQEEKEQKQPQPFQQKEEMDHVMVSIPSVETSPEEPALDSLFFANEKDE